MIVRYTEEIAQMQPSSVLEVGCGTGVVLRRMKDVLPETVRLAGADVSECLLEKAREKDPSIEWKKVEAERLSFANASFDIVVMHTLLSHVDDPVALLAEAKRVLVPGGTIVVFDADHAGTTYGLADAGERRRIDHLLSSAIAVQADVCSQLPRYAAQAGLSIQSHSAEVISECGRGDYWLSSVKAFLAMFPKVPILSEEDAAYCGNEMLRSHEEGTFFASGTFYTYFLQ
ncbi:methyltransferase domain-containing protein [Rubritalea spongiae]|uniref:Methyltransferase domain-containing protein n=3 Tax=Rubritalea spongiae TaxID=430797 RepID=A0ABW5E4M6_9BACT